MSYVQERKNFSRGTKIVRHDEFEITCWSRLWLLKILTFFCSYNARVTHRWKPSLEAKSWLLKNPSSLRNCRSSATRRFSWLWNLVIWECTERRILIIGRHSHTVIVITLWTLGFVWYFKARLFWIASGGKSWLFEIRAHCRCPCGRAFSVSCGFERPPVCISTTSCKRQRLYPVWIFSIKLRAQRCLESLR